MKKVLIVIVSLFIILSLGGCGDSATKAVEKYLAKYNSLDSEVLPDIHDIVEKENLSDDDKDTYVAIFKKQYTDLKYDIVNEEYDGDEATIKVKVTVYDLYKAQKNASDYLIANTDEFNEDEGNYDAEKFIKYKLDQMKKTSTTVDYTIDFYVVKTSNGWVVSSLSNSDLEKIHGIYDYES